MSIVKSAFEPSEFAVYTETVQYIFPLPPHP